MRYLIVFVYYIDADVVIIVVFLSCELFLDVFVVSQYSFFLQFCFGIIFWSLYSSLVLFVVLVLQQGYPWEAFLLVWFCGVSLVLG